jgi:hypothetical protein
MTIEITMHCDAMDCSRSIEIDDYTDADVGHAGWHNDPLTGGQHYCKVCWPKIKHEFDEE